MSGDQLFNSKTDPIPEVRRDLQIIPIERNGNSYLYFHDTRGYASRDLAVHRQTSTLLSLLDGRKSINDLKPYLGEDTTTDQLLKFIQFLDKNGILDSPRFNTLAEEVEGSYEQYTVHEAVTAGESYPDDPEELRAYLDEAFENQNINLQPDTGSAKALYAPHIDPRVSIQCYVDAFSAVKNMEPQRVVVLATSHYSGLYSDTYDNKPFTLVDKDFKLPLGTVRRDQKAISGISEQKEGLGVTLHDRAHRLEHSIELHLLFLSYMWQHDFEVVPFLVNGLDDLYYLPEGHLGKQLENFSGYLMDQFGDDEQTLFLISGDLSHIGKKFGDRQPASKMFDEVKKFDRKFLQIASENQRQALFDLMREEMDPYRVCGFAPLYTFLSAMPEVRGKILSYDLWDEKERESAVSFGSILFTKKN